jgi:hypothetical protein
VKREAAKKQALEAKRNRTKKEKKVAKIKNTVKEWDDFASEERMFKRFKQGKISKEEYDKFLLNTK